MEPVIDHFTEFLALVGQMNAVHLFRYRLASGITGIVTDAELRASLSERSPSIDDLPGPTTCWGGDTSQPQGCGKTDILACELPKHKVEWTLAVGAYTVR